jgi:putative sigma-54 modulation protein
VEVTVSSRHTEVSELLRASTVDKISKLGRFLEGMDRAEVHFSEHQHRRVADKEVCEVTLVGHGHHVRCKVAAPDGFAAVDKAVEKLEHQLHKLKTKLVRRSHQPARRANGASAEAPEGAADANLDMDTDTDFDDGAQPRIVKSKTFQTKPMTPQEAALQMDLLGHDFFFFTSSETERATVVYRRDDGDIGLIDQA